MKKLNGYKRFYLFLLSIFLIIFCVFECCIDNQKYSTYKVKLILDCGDTIIYVKDKNFPYSGNIDKTDRNNFKFLDTNYVSKSILYVNDIKVIKQ